MTNAELRVLTFYQVYQGIYKVKKLLWIKNQDKKSTFYID
jgi:hypothetical protein